MASSDTVHRFRNPMDPDSIAERLQYPADDSAYRLAVQAAGHQSAFTVDPLARKLRAELPALIARLARDVEREATTPVSSERAALVQALVRAGDELVEFLSGPARPELAGLDERIVQWAQARAVAQSTPFEAAQELLEHGDQLARACYAARADHTLRVIRLSTWDEAAAAVRAAGIAD